MGELGYDGYLQLMIARPDLFPKNGSGFKILPPHPEHSALCYADPYILVIRDYVLFPDGQKEAYVRIVSPPYEAVGAAILPVIADGVVLLNHQRHATQNCHLEIPRGFADEGEIDSSICAARELREETGLGEGALTRLGAVYPDTGLLSSRVDLFLYQSQEVIEELRTEVGVDALVMPIKDLLIRVREGQITDGFTLSAVLNAQIMGLL